MSAIYKLVFDLCFCDFLGYKFEVFQQLLTLKTACVHMHVLNIGRGCSRTGFVDFLTCWAPGIQQLSRGQDLGGGCCGITTLGMS